MSLVGFCADVHIGNHQMFGGPIVGGLNQRAMMAVNCLIDACRAAQARGATDFVVCGDLFDNHHASPQMIAHVMRAFSFFAGRKHIIKGNHDAASEAAGDNALAPLSHVPGIHVWDEPGFFVLPGSDAVLAFFPYAKGDAATWLPGAVETIAREIEDHGIHPSALAMAIHLGLLDTSVPNQPWAIHATDKISDIQLKQQARRIDAEAAYLGNWHTRYVVEDKERRFTGVQVGSLCPTGFDNPGLVDYGGVEFWSPGEPYDPQSRIEIPGPRFVYRTPHKATSNTVFVQLQGTATLRDLMERELIDAKADYSVADGIVRVKADRKAVVQQVQGARTVSSTRDAVETWIQESQAIDAGEKDAVRSTCNAYIRDF